MPKNIRHIYVINYEINIAVPDNCTVYLINTYVIELSYTCNPQRHISIIPRNMNRNQSFTISTETEKFD